MQGADVDDEADARALEEAAEVRRVADAADVEGVAAEGLDGVRGLGRGEHELAASVEAPDQRGDLAQLAALDAQEHAAPGLAVFRDEAEARRGEGLVELPH